MQTAPLPQLQVFLAVARHRSFSGAARELGVSTSAVSQAIKQLESQLRVVLLNRTTRSVSPTEAGQRLVESAGPAMKQTLEALTMVSAKPGEVVGRVKISVGRSAVPLVIAPVIPTFRARHPRIEVEIVVEERLVDIVGEGYDAGVRLAESIERDMVQVRLTSAFRFVIVGTPEYLAKHGTPRKPEDLLEHECIAFRFATTGTLYAWELERGRRHWRVPVRGRLIANEPQLALAFAEQGLGLTYASEPAVAEKVRAGRLKIVLDAYAPTVPGYFLYYPSRAQSSPALRLFVDVAKELLVSRR
ncbi:MAG: LysR family transcriptional regulator [Kofleriaceae bacterium]|nr:LysR family transcriptional regulator [Kofleriaceae bacterium]